MTTTTQLMTADELMLLEDDGFRHELVRGELLTFPLNAAQHGFVAANVIVLLGNYLKTNRLGQLLGYTGFQLESNPDTVLAADISFIVQERLGALSDGYFPGPPDLAVEVLSPSDERVEVDRRAMLWLSFGAKSVWLVDPQQETVEVWGTGSRKVLHQTDELVDDTVPGFRVKVSEIFA